MRYRLCVEISPVGRDDKGKVEMTRGTVDTGSILISFTKNERIHWGLSRVLRITSFVSVSAKDQVHLWSADLFSARIPHEFRFTVMNIGSEDCLSKKKNYLKCIKLGLEV